MLGAYASELLMLLKTVLMAPATMLTPLMPWNFTYRLRSMLRILASPL
jgi:hypothetical protein